MKIGRCLEIRGGGGSPCAAVGPARRGTQPPPSDGLGRIKSLADGPKSNRVKDMDDGGGRRMEVKIKKEHKNTDFFFTLQKTMGRR
jgi:hypothetical protein